MYDKNDIDAKQHTPIFISIGSEFADDSIVRHAVYRKHSRKETVSTAQITKFHHEPFGNIRDISFIYEFV